MSKNRINVMMPEYSTAFRSTDEQRYNALFPIEITLETSHPGDCYNVIVSLFHPGFCSNYAMKCNDPHNPANRGNLHVHDFFELCYVIRGEMYQNIEGRRHLYPSGSLCLMNTNVHHAEEFSTAFRAAFISLPLSLVNYLFRNDDLLFPELEPFSKSSLIYHFFYQNYPGASMGPRRYIDFIPVDTTAHERHNMYRRIEGIITHLITPGPGATHLIFGALLKIFSALENETLYKTIPINIGTEKEADIFDEITALLLDSDGRMSRSELANELNYNGAYINAIVKKYTGESIFGYASSICMKKAAQMLIETDLSIESISEILQFSNRSHFYRLFEKQFGVSPKQYRTNYRK